jgi:hypothetical protein
MAVLDTHLEAIAHRVVWWRPPELTLLDRDEFLCRVMSKGAWEDIEQVEAIYGEEAFREALRNCPPHAMDAASWHYWHGRLGVEVPAAPSRARV